MLLRIASLLAAAWVAGAGLAHADPEPSPPPDAPKCLSMNPDPMPHMQYLPCGWSWSSTGHWIPPQP